MVNTRNIPAQLWIGSPSLLEQKAITYVQQYACIIDTPPCRNCINCMGIASKNHASCIWVHPEKGYTLEILVPVFKALAFSLEGHNHFFIILQKADVLNDACANKLLKVMEEPPEGYQFILLAENKQNVISTIQSRCIISFSKDYEELKINAQLFELFIHERSVDKLHFYLEHYTIGEQESIFFAEKLYEHYIQEFQKISDIDQKRKYKKYIQRIQKVLAWPPMPGSAKLFLKNLFLIMREEKNDPS